MNSMDSTAGKFPYQKVVVTGGAGFLGRFVVQKLASYPNVEIFVPRSSEYDLVQGSDVERLLAETKPHLVIHVAAVVGGIGYNQENHGRLFYEDLMMGAQLIEQSRLQGVEKFVATVTVRGPAKFTLVPVNTDKVCNG